MLTLREKEEIVHRAHLHWRVIFQPAVKYGYPVGVSLALCYLASYKTIIPAFVALPSLILTVVLFLGIVGYKSIEYLTTNILITNFKVVYARGLINRRITEVVLFNIREIDYVDLWRNSATVVITLGNGTWQTIPHVQNFEDFIKNVDEQLKIIRAQQIRKKRKAG